MTNGDDAPVMELFPEMLATTRLAAPAGSTLIACAGFEDRAFASLEALEGVTSSVLLRYSPFDQRNRLEEMQAVLRARFGLDELRVLDYHRYEPDGFPDELRNALCRLATRRVILDVSAMSKLAIMLCLDVAQQLDLAVTIFYAEAAEYGPRRQDYEDQKSSGTKLGQPTISVDTGVQGIVRAGRLGSVAMQGQPIAAIAFTSFNDQLLQALLNAVYPSRLYLINGARPVHTWREEATAWIHERLRAEWPPEDNPLDERGLPARRASTLDYRESLHYLLQIYWEMSVDHRIVLAPTGSKMQTVAAYFLKAIQPDVHVEYPTPKSFLDLYSKGTGKRWRVEFPSLGEFVRRIQLASRRQWLGIPNLDREL